MKQTTLFPMKETPVFRQFLPEIETVSKKPAINLWKIPYTISQLSYLVHNHYRYYGKFPSVVAGQILDQFQPENSHDWVLDNFCGSGTTLVEAKLRGVRSVGIDVSWLSALASNVKTRHVDLQKLRADFSKVASSFVRSSNIKVDDDFVAKWFTETASTDLFKLSRVLERQYDNSAEFDFLLIGFLAIIRRVSRAFDGEVRPHINKKKKERDVFSAYEKKIRDMSKRHEEFMSLTSCDTEARAVVANNLQLPLNLADGRCYLAISHPPYLNSFNYTPVYSLEYYWGKPFEKHFVPENFTGLSGQELKAHPATEAITQSYFEHLKKCYEEVYSIQDAGGLLAVVIGDCTRNKKLIPVLDRTIEVVEEIGYETVQVNYRTTHYGLGKYAYRHRANYHGDAEKKDGILVFRK